MAEHSDLVESRACRFPPLASMAPGPSYSEDGVFRYARGSVASVAMGRIERKRTEFHRKGPAKPKDGFDGRLLLTYCGPIDPPLLHRWSGDSLVQGFLLAIAVG